MKLLRKHKQKEENPEKLYLASPYTHKNTNVMGNRFIIACFLAGYFTELGYCVYSPILNGHMMSKYFDFPPEYKFWAARDKQFIRWCDTFGQVRLNGWGDSTGMARELTYARLLNRTLKTITLSTGLSEREFAMECLFLKVNGRFSEKVNLNITVREMN